MARIDKSLNALVGYLKKVTESLNELHKPESSNELYKSKSSLKKSKWRSYGTELKSFESENNEKFMQEIKKSVGSNRSASRKEEVLRKNKSIPKKKVLRKNKAIPEKKKEKFLKSKKNYWERK